MSTAARPGDNPGTATATADAPDRSELGVAALLALLGAVMLYNASQLSTNIASTGAVGPKAVPYVVGALLLIVSVFLALDVLRGVKGDPEGGEDVDLSSGADWMTVALLAVAFLSNAVLIERIGWPFSGAIMFFIAAYALGSRHIVRDIVISLILSFGTWHLFVLVLGINLPAGLLEGIL